MENILKRNQKDNETRRNTVLLGILNVSENHAIFPFRNSKVFDEFGSENREKTRKNRLNPLFLLFEKNYIKHINKNVGRNVSENLYSRIKGGHKLVKHFCC